MKAHSEKMAKPTHRTEDPAVSGGQARDGLQPAQPAESRAAAESPKRLTVRGAIFLGVGAMLGAGIFALLGEAGAVAGSAVWISFLVAGVITTLLGYTVVKLGVRYPSSGGIVAYLMEGFGNGRLVGVASWLGYFAAILLVGAMIAVSFGDYASSLFIGANAAKGWSKLFASLIVLAMGALNIKGARGVDKIQSMIVVTLLVVFAVFIVATFTQLNSHLLAPSGYPTARKIISSVALTFFAYLGFAVISFTAGDLPDPERSLPQAMYVALAVTTVLYIAISIGVFGSLTVDQVVKYGPTAIAEAARPALGQAGFTIMSIAALLATSSSVNATLYASNGFTGTLAKVGQFPPVFGARSGLGKHGGLLITIVLTLILVNFFNLSTIASVGSAVSLSVFVLVGIAGFRLRGEIRARSWPIVLAIFGAGAVLLFFAVDTLRHDPRTFAAMAVLIVLAIALDLVWKWIRDRHTPAPSGA
jgi:amino acid transporter